MKYLFKFAIGNIQKSLFTLALNLIGLVSAFTAFILILLYVWNEYHFDRYNKNADNIYRIEVKYPDTEKTSTFLFGPTGESLKQEFPEIIAATTYMPWGKWQEGTFSWENNIGKITEFEDYAYSDEKLTEIFTFNFTKGKKELPLLEPQSAIVSESFANKAWGNEDPIGKPLTTSGATYVVAAVFEDLHANSVITCPIVLKLPTEGTLAEDAKGWNITNYPQFILVQPGTNPELLSEKINAHSIVKEKHNQYVNKGKTVELIVRPLRDLRFTTEVAETPIFTANNKVFVDSLLLVGILIFLVALINYINFATANIPTRLKSVNITRIIGSGKAEVIFTFLTETFVLFTAAVLAAVFLAFIINKEFSNLVLGYQLPFSNYFQLIVLTGIFCIISGLLAGIYPAFYSIAGNPIVLIKQTKYNPKINLRGILTVSQFAATIALIVTSITVLKQVQFMKNADLGFSKDQTLIIRLNNEIKNNIDVFQDRLQQLPYVSEFAFSRAVPGQAQERNTIMVGGERCQVWYWASDAKYLQLMNFQLLDGRFFIEDSKAENGNKICNETAAKKYGWKVGQKIGDGTLVGIIKDFNFVSLRESVEPFTFWYSSSMNAFMCVSIKLNTDKVGDALQAIRKIYNEVSPVVPFRYFFMDEHMNELYSKENQQVKLIGIFSFLSVIVSILGILGLSTFLCQYKIKEIGVRKVNGAKVSEILTMLNRDFIKWIAIAFIIAVPFAWFAMHKWLENFAYKTTLNWWIFAVAGVLALGIALLTVSWQSWRAATRNPVEALRYE